MGSFTISNTLMKNAVTYMPIAQKRELARDIASRCVVGKGVAERNREGEKLLAFPPIVAEDIALKNMLLLNVLLGHYFKVDIPEKDEHGARFDSCLRHDYYASGHLLNQIERFKGDANYKNKAFNILADYKEFKNMVDVEIFNLKELNNDPLARFVAAIEVFSTPEMMRDLFGQLKEASDKYADKLRERGIVGEGAEKDG